MYAEYLDEDKADPREVEHDDPTCDRLSPDGWYECSLPAHTTGTHVAGVAAGMICAEWDEDRSTDTPEEVR